MAEEEAGSPPSDQASGEAPEQARGDGQDTSLDGNQDGCTSEVTEYGLLCTTCPDDGDAPPECLVADCTVIDRCLQCRDPRDRIGEDCSLDYESLPIASIGFGGGDTFNVCAATYGAPGGAGGSCHYPGPDSCTFSQDGDARCIECTYPGGAGTGICLYDPSEPLPDVMAGRPADLPEPGECVTDTRQDGLVECSTCTREDLSATMSCRFSPAESCDYTGVGDAFCIACPLEAGGA